jgi:ketopantoate reductase
MKKPRRAFVIGMGEVGRRVAGAFAAAGVEVVPVTRAAGWDEAAAPHGDPRVVCVGETQLADVLPRLAAAPPAALAFVQNGWVRPDLDGVPGHTRGLIWFTTKGEFFRVLRPSPFAGPLAPFLAAALTAGGLDGEALDDAAFRAAEADKMGFNCVVGLPLAVRRVSLGEYLERHGDEARAVFGEAVEVCAAALGVAVEPRWWDAFLHAVEPLAWVRASAPKALFWRNGAVTRLAAELGLAAPANAALLAAAGA